MNYIHKKQTPINIETMKNDRIQYEVETSKEGIPTLSIERNGIKSYFHSRVAPSRDARIFDQQFFPEKYDTLVMLGLGLGYHLTPLRDIAGQFRAIIIIDIIEGIHRELAPNPLTSFLSGTDNITILTGMKPEEVIKYLEQALDVSSMKGIQVLAHPQFARIFPEYCNAVKTGIDSLLTKKAGNAATKRAFGLRFLKNALKSLPLIPQCFPASDLKDACSGLPAVIITSGPSLEPLLPGLLEMQKNVIIIAADSALPVLVRSGITPDITVSIDPQPYIREHYMRSPLRPGLHIVTPTSDISAFGNGGCVLSLNSHPFSQLIDELFPDITGSVDSSTGTVAGDAIQTGLYLGCSPVAVLGFDFSFPRMKIYARGTAYQDRYALFFQDRFKPVETRNMDYIRTSSGALREQGRFTRKSFLQYRNAIGQLLRQQPGTTVYNLGAGGLPVEGVPGISLEDFSGRYCPAALRKDALLNISASRSNTLREKIDFTMLKSALKDPVVFERLMEASGVNLRNKTYRDTLQQMVNIITAKNKKQGDHT
ncbi:MAG TPA: DUF115 domain-containing protein [Spirochaetota bacterium]|nr:DUF115 domain-containing protein [Spirochaetota bacterium]